MNWSVRPDKRFRLALGSFVEEYNNKVQVVSLDEDTSEFTAKSTFDHPYPTTKIMWIPDSKVRGQGVDSGSSSLLTMYTEWLQFFVTLAVRPHDECIFREFVCRTLMKWKLKLVADPCAAISVILCPLSCRASTRTCWPPPGTT